MQVYYLATNTQNLYITMCAYVFEVFDRKKEECQWDEKENTSQMFLDAITIETHIKKIALYNKFLLSNKNGNNFRLIAHDHLMSIVHNLVFFHEIDMLHIFNFESLEFLFIFIEFQQNLCFELTLYFYFIQTIVVTMI